MLKTILTAVVTAAVCTGAGAAATAAHVFNLHVGDFAAIKSIDFHCQVLTKTQVACGGYQLPNSLQVYYSPTQVAVVKFGTPKNGKITRTILLNQKR
jgi:hypothetical protein